MMSKIDEIFRRILNDPAIFYPRFTIFNKTEWTQMKKEFKNGNINSLKGEIEKKKKAIASESQAIRSLDELLKVLNTAPNLFSERIELLDTFALVHYNISSNLDDYGKVIERYDVSTVEQFFLDKINRLNDRRTKIALTKLLDYVKELYFANISVEEIAYFVRKLKSLELFWKLNV